jgi:hypothetical protein
VLDDAQLGITRIQGAWTEALQCCAQVAMCTTKAVLSHRVLLHVALNAAIDNRHKGSSTEFLQQANNAEHQSPSLSRVYAPRGLGVVRKNQTPFFQCRLPCQVPTADRALPNRSLHHQPQSDRCCFSEATLGAEALVIVGRSGLP